MERPWNQCSKNIRTPNYLFFNEELKFLVRIFHTQFLKQSMFEASEALQKPEGTKKNKNFVVPLIFMKF